MIIDMRLLISAMLLLLVSGISNAAEVNAVRSSASSTSLRIVVELDEAVDYASLVNNNSITLKLPMTKLSASLSDPKVYDGMLRDFSFSRSGLSTNLFIETSYPVNAKVFALKSPFRIVIDIPREEIKASEEPRSEGLKKFSEDPGPDIKKTGLLHINNVINGVSYYRINRDKFKAYALLVDQSSAEVFPMISVPSIRTASPDLLGSMLNFFGFADKGSEPSSHFSKRSVKSFVNLTGATAGVNGSFFFGDGTPVGAVIVNGQVISTPLYNRTALIIYKNGKAAISSVKMDGFLKFVSGKTIGFDGVNQPMKDNRIVVYTPDYQITDGGGNVVNFTLVNDIVTSVSYGQTKIPPNAVVISASGVQADALKGMLKDGSPLKWFFITSPPMDDIMHAVAAGPRLVSNGSVYVTSKEEKFRNDVSKSKASRTAAGINSRGDLIFVVVEGAGGEKGVSLEELSDLMIELGAVEAMNLDGGGSSSMVINGSRVNSGYERPVSNAIVVRKK